MNILFRFPRPVEHDNSQDRNDIRDEYAHFCEEVRDAASFTRLKMSAAMIETDCDQPEKRDAFEEHLAAMTDLIFSDRLRDLRRRYDNVGGDPSTMPWPLEEGRG